MRFLTARSLVLTTLASALVLFVLVPGCAKQSEGERCGDSIGAGASDDCGDGLTCTPKGDLLNGADGAHRCCYTDGHVSDSRCEPVGPGGLPAGGNGSGGTGPVGEAGSGGTGPVGEAGSGGTGPVGEAGSGGSIGEAGSGEGS
jgi:hypothetical protein